MDRITKNDSLKLTGAGSVERHSDDRPRDQHHLRMADLKGSPVGHTKPKWYKGTLAKLILDFCRPHGTLVYPTGPPVATRSPIGRASPDAAPGETTRRAKHVLRLGILLRYRLFPPGEQFL